MAARDETGRGAGHDTRAGPDAHSHGHSSTETKASVQTTELIAYVVVLLGVLIAGAVVDGGDDASDPDRYTADKVWLYATILTVGYMISRGLAKAGSREHYSGDH